MDALEYLAWEREQLDRHEYRRGEVLAIAGESLRHSALDTIYEGIFEIPED